MTRTVGCFFHHGLIQCLHPGDLDKGVVQPLASPKKGEIPLTGWQDVPEHFLFVVLKKNNSEHEPKFTIVFFLCLVTFFNPNGTVTSAVSPRPVYTLPGSFQRRAVFGTSRKRTRCPETLVLIATVQKIQKFQF